LNLYYTHCAKELDTYFWQPYPLSEEGGFDIVLTTSSLRGGTKFCSDLFVRQEMPPYAYASASTKCNFLILIEITTFSMGKNTNNNNFMGNIFPKDISSCILEIIIKNISGA